MAYERLETKLIRTQNQYIKSMEAQLAVLLKKDAAQERLIEELRHALEMANNRIDQLDPGRPTEDPEA